jgi:hypothetical protein
MRRIFFSLMLLFTVGVFAQNCPLNSPEFPFETQDDWYTYGWSANLYHPNQMGGAQTINSISIRLDNTEYGSYTYNNIKIRVRNSTVTSYSSSSYPGTTGFTEVFSGNFTFNGAGVYTFNFSSSFAYDGISTYEVLFENQGGTDNTSYEPWFDVTDDVGPGVYPGKVGWGDSWPSAKSSSGSKRTFNLAIGGAGCIYTLPVTLIANDLVCNDGLPILNWTTSTEINNDYFTIESSDDGKEWVIEQKIKGQGNSKIEHQYSVQLDKSRLSKYYRLSQTDFDGAHKNLVTHYANCNQNQKISLYPNPATTDVTISSEDPIHQSDIKIFNHIGQQVVDYTLNNQVINLSKLSKGLYFIQIQGESKRLIIK